MIPGLLVICLHLTVFLFNDFEGKIFTFYAFFEENRKIPLD